MTSVALLSQHAVGLHLQGAFRNQGIAAAFFVSVLTLSIEPAHAGPCSNQIAQFELAVRQSAGNPNAGPMASQSIGAQLDRQPTPDTIRRAEEQAQAKFAAILARAKRFDAKGDRAGCTQALSDAKGMYNLQ